MLKIQPVMPGGSSGADSRCPQFSVPGEAASLPGLFPIGLLRRFCKTARPADLLRLFIFTGFPGGFTTFSTFTPENSQIFKADPWRFALFKSRVRSVFGIPPLLKGHEITNICPFAA